MTNQTSPTAFQFAYKALGINIPNGRGLSRSMLLVTVEEEQSNAVHICRSFRSKNPLTSCMLLTRRSALILKVGMPCALRSSQRQTGL